MLYRVLFGLIPTILIALVVTGAMPVSNAIGVTGGVDDVAGRVGEEGGEGSSQAEPPRGPNPPEVVRNAQDASEVFDSVDHSLEAEIKRRAPEEKKRDARIRREQLEQSGKVGWVPKGGGWGS